jgi:integrase
MARPRSSGVKQVVRKRRDGTVLRIDYYDPRTMEFLGNDRDAAMAAVAGGGKPGRIDTFGQLATAYLASPDFQRLAPATQKLNRLYVDELRERFRDLEPAAITRPVVRRLRDAFAVQPVKGNRLVATLRRLLSYGVAVGVVRDNAASRPGRLPEAPRSAVYSDAQIERFLAAADPVLRRAMALMLYTVQRPADVLAMGPQHVTYRDGRAWISLRQAKTGELIDVPLHSRAAAILAEPLPPRSGRRAAAILAPALLVPSPTGRAWMYRNFCRAWDKARARADYRLARQMLASGASKDEVRVEMLAGLQRRDLRRTGMVRMAEAGASTAQIAAVSGHRIEQVQRILDTYIPRRSEVAAGAIAAWESGQRSNVVVFQNIRTRANAG